MNALQHAIVKIMLLGFILAGDTTIASAMVTLTDADNRRTTAAVNEKMTQVEQLENTEIGVATKDGEVTLTGTVSLLQHKYVAEQAAKHVPKVKSVRNKITVTKSSVDDDEIHDNVVAALRKLDSVVQPAIKVSVDNGHVGLIGKVQSLAIKRVSEYVASGIEGVQSIQNQITVALPKDKTDEMLRDEIKALITQSIELDADTIEVEVENNTVKMAGKVICVFHKDKLEQIAEIPGIQKVDLSNVRIE